MKTAARCAHLRCVLPFALCAMGGLAWLAGGRTLLGPLASLLLPLAASLALSRRHAFAAALLYYLIGSISIPGAIAGYWASSGTEAQIMPLGMLAWLGASTLLALPWALGRAWQGRLCALALTALPPLGVIGWLSPLNAAGVLFPGTQPGLAWLGVVATVGLIAGIRTPAIIMSAGALSLSLNMPLALQTTPAPGPLPGWRGVNTAVLPAGADVAKTIAAQQEIISTAIAAGGLAPSAPRVLVLPESVLENWLPGTREQFALAVPPGQTWLIGAQDGRRNAVVAVQAGKAGAPVTLAAGLLLGGNWRPWDARTLVPAWWQAVFRVNSQRVWAALCVEQLQPWTWLEALAQSPTVILAMSNDWWAARGSFALPIEAASTRAWARLMHVPIVWAQNQPDGSRPYPRRVLR